MGELERMVILPPTRSGRMKLRWVTVLTNWITSARSRLSKFIKNVFASLPTILWSTGLPTVGGPSRRRVVVAAASGVGAVLRVAGVRMAAREGAMLGRGPGIGRSDPVTPGTGP